MPGSPEAGDKAYQSAANLCLNLNKTRRRDNPHTLKLPRLQKVLISRDQVFRSTGCAHSRMRLSVGSSVMTSMRCLRMNIAAESAAGKEGKTIWGPDHIQPKTSIWSFTGTAKIVCL